MSEDHEPEATIYTAVFKLERKHYTRAEIASALRVVADDIGGDE